MTLIALYITCAALLPILAAGIAKAGGKSYSNHDPREWLAKQTGYRARANAAQSNTFEALPLFYVAVTLCLIRLPEAQLPTLGWYMLAWLSLRLLYIVCYVKDWATPRSLVWMAALFINFMIVWLFAMV